MAHLWSAGVDVLLMVAGLGVLSGLGLLGRSPLRILGALGLAFMIGTATVLMLTIVLMTVGVPFGLLTIALVALAVAAAGVALALGRHGRRDGRRLARLSLDALLAAPRTATASTRGSSDRSLRGRARRVSVDGWVIAAFCGAFGAFAVVGLTKAVVTPLIAWDAWTMWMRKAAVIFYYGGLPPEFFASETYRFTSPDYPLLLPLMEAVHFRAFGTIDSVAIHVQFWLLLIGFVWAAAFLAHRVTRPAVWAPVLLLVAVAPGVWGQLLTAYADVPMAMFLALGALCLGTWLARRRGEDLALAALLLAAAASTKNEGLMAAVAALAVAAVVVALERPRNRLRPLAMAGGVFVALVAPWRIWVTLNGVEGQIPVAQGLNPAFLVDRTWRVAPAVSGLVDALDDSIAWTYVLPLGIAVVIAAAVVGAARPAALFYLGTMAVVSGLIVWAYWISPSELGWHIGTSVGRVSTTVVFLALAGLLHLAGELERFGKGRPEPAAADEPERPPREDPSAPARLVAS